MCKCLYCYKELEEGQRDYHPGCSRKFFGTKDVPLLEYKHEDLDQLAEQVIRLADGKLGYITKRMKNL
jgi:serine/threonine-protein kinase HipA